MDRYEMVEKGDEYHNASCIKSVQNYNLNERVKQSS